MLKLLLALSAGIIVGFVKGSFSKKDKKNIQKFMNYLLFLLILSMGAEIGYDKEIISKLPDLGISAAFISMSTIFGSILAVLIMEKILIGGQEW